MTKTELLHSLVGKKVEIIFTDGDKKSGILGFTKEFSEEYGFRKPKYFTIGNISFKPIHVKGIRVNNCKLFYG